MKLCDKLARLKSRRGLTTDALSQKSGVPKGTINKLLNGETRNPTISQLDFGRRAVSIDRNEGS